MTEISYLCTGDDGITTEVSTLSEAKDFTMEHGGKYQIQYDSVLSESEAFARKSARKRPRAGSKRQSVVFE